MAIIPMKQTVTVRRKSDPDRWGNAPDIEFTLKCRIQENTKLARRTNYTSGTTTILAESVVSKAQIMFDKYVDVTLTDEISFTDESGVAQTYLPININRIRGLNGKAILTEVEV